MQNCSFFQDLILERVRPLFLTRMKLGEFDPPHMNPYNDLDLSVIQSVPHRQLSTLSAMQSFVLLKNDGILPIKKIYQKVAVSLAFRFFKTKMSRHN
jgi:beta-glucosidase